MNRITLNIAGRVVYWDITPELMAIITQNLVQSLGPAEEDTNG